MIYNVVMSREIRTKATTKKQDKQQNTTKSAFTAAELKACREKLGRDMAEMAFELNTPLRTYQDWEYGKSRIPGICEITVGLLLEKDRWATERALQAAIDSYDRYLAGKEARHEEIAQY